ncbi:MAG: hypothetical protein FWF66_00260, partial [Candidatus Bathyarchaeota archaeon]|nr:hypothetical protein [Candidatus Termiticorpusculum sp.]
YYVDYPNPTNGVVDTTLSSYTGAKHKFTFIWTCVNGGTTVNGVSNYGYTDANGRVVGMPLAWTQKTNLSKTGYTNPDGSGYAYIGFENTSKYLTDNRDFINGNYGDFCRQFYYYAFVQHLPIKTSLDRATQDVMANPKVTFASTSLYNGYWFTNTVHGITSRCYMRVIGDGNMVLPY